jgi:hypothetical protein
MPELIQKSSPLNPLPPSLYVAPPSEPPEPPSPTDIRANWECSEGFRTTFLIHFRLEDQEAFHRFAQFLFDASGSASTLAAQGRELTVHADMRQSVRSARSPAPSAAKAADAYLRVRAKTGLPVTDATFSDRALLSSRSCTCCTLCRRAPKTSSPNEAYTSPMRRPLKEINAGCRMVPIVVPISFARELSLG